MTPPLMPSTDTAANPQNTARVIATNGTGESAAPGGTVADDDLSTSFTFLTKVHEMCAGTESHSVAIWDVGRKMGLDETVSEQIASDLQELNMLHYTSLAGDVALTSFGVSEIILARSQPDMPTTHFPALASFGDQMHLPLSLDSDTISDLIDRFSQVSGWMPDHDFMQKANATSSAEKLADQLEQEAQMWESYQADIFDDQAAMGSCSDLQASIDSLATTLTKRVRRPKELTQSLIAELEDIWMDLEDLVPCT